MNKKISFIGRYLCSLFLLGLIFLPLISLAATDATITNLDNVVKETSLAKTTNLYPVIGKIINVLLGFLGVVFIILILFAGFQWMTAAGDSGKVTKAKDLIRNAVIGLIIVLAAYAISYTIIDEIQKAIK